MEAWFVGVVLSVFAGVVLFVFAIVVLAGLVGFGRIIHALLTEKH